MNSLKTSLVSRVAMESIPEDKVVSLLQSGKTLVQVAKELKVAKLAIGLCLGKVITRTGLTTKEAVQKEFSGLQAKDFTDYDLLPELTKKSVERFGQAPNRNKKWTSEEKDQVDKLLDEGKSIREVAKEVGRSDLAIKFHIKAKDLSDDDLFKRFKSLTSDEVSEIKELKPKYQKSNENNEAVNAQIELLATRLTEMDKKIDSLTERIESVLSKLGN